MVSAIKEITIFMLIAQAVLIFVPGSSYMKYVRVLVGVIMIMRIVEPLLSLVFDEEKKQQIIDETEMFGKILEEGGEGLEVRDDKAEIYGRVEKELKEKLGQCGSGYEILNVDLSGGVYAEDGALGGGYEGDGSIVITVSADPVGPADEESTSGWGGPVRIGLVKVETGAQDGGGSDIKEDNAEKGDLGEHRGEEEALKERFGDQLGVAKERIQIIFE